MIDRILSDYRASVQRLDIRRWPLVWVAHYAEDPVCILTVTSLPKLDDPLAKAVFGLCAPFGFTDRISGFGVVVDMQTPRRLWFCAMKAIYHGTWSQPGTVTYGMDDHGELDFGTPDFQPLPWPSVTKALWDIAGQRLKGTEYTLDEAYSAAMATLEAFYATH